jgi:adenylate cyclase
VVHIAETRDRSLLAVAHSLAGIPLLSFADLASARAHLEQAVGLYDFEGHRTLASEHGDDPGLTSLAFLAIALWLAGLPDRALARVREADALAERLAAPYGIAFAHGFAAWIHVRRGEAAEARARCDALLRIAAEQGFAFLRAEGAVFRGWARVQEGRFESGLEELHDGLAAQLAAGARIGRAAHLALLADACLHADRPDEGLAAVGEGLETVAATGERSYEAELHRLKGELLARRAAHGGGGADAVRDVLRHALDVAHAQGTRSLELRAALSLARLEEGRRRESARRRLGEVYASFSEGFGTADLRAARSFLEGPPGSR